MQLFPVSRYVGATGMLSMTPLVGIGGHCYISSHYVYIIDDMSATLSTSRVCRCNWTALCDPLSG